MVVYVMAASIAWGAQYVWRAHDLYSEFVITRPEVLKLHNDQENEIRLTGGKIDYILDARIAQLQQRIGALREKARQGHASAYDLKTLAELEAELKAVQQSRGK